jgi:hypothetical protein
VVTTVNPEKVLPSSAELWAEFEAIKPPTDSGDPTCSACGHPKSMHLSYGGCSYTEVNGQNCPCTTKRSDIK